MVPSPAPVRRVLCVVSPQDVCEIVEIILSEYQVITVRTISEARLWLEREKFDLVVSGDYMFDGTTADLCEFVSSLQPEVPVIVLAAPFRMLDSEASEAGACKIVRYTSQSWPEDLRLAADEVSRVA